MAEQQNKKKDIAVDLECDDEFEEFGNEGEWFSSAHVVAQTAQLLQHPTLKQKGYHFPSSSFLRAEWGQEEEDAEDVNQWEEDWDDSDQNDDFTRQLRAQLERHA